MRKLFLFLISLTVFPSIASAEAVEIWSYAFVTMPVEEPMSGYGASIFRPLEEGTTGPMLDAERNEYEVVFSVDGPRANGKLRSKLFGDFVVELNGDVAVYERNGNCFELIRLFGGRSVNYVVLQRSFEGKCPGAGA